MSDWIEINKDDKHVARERQKAREMRSSQWWIEQLRKGRCHYCDGIFPPDELTMDHIVPLSRGGRSTKGNIVPCCKKCNDEKKYLTPAELIMRRIENDEHKQR
ncbi:MAG: HNH endonuclease [Victivallaceae bacterium]|nr:HNH endonuclease [Victivallaceae bacterium]NLK82925.1 HNH endonuclease [Lentisphaerota bacterium]MDD3116013.1 HNH endonuclease [Victivallaceae bacterium]MDD3704225.1 HNH endonuclease [Victivallaceae bacterium]MDD4318388.1 HNH endonuclease [Victivallaceae bacterium]